MEMVQNMISKSGCPVANQFIHGRMDNVNKWTEMDPNDTAEVWINVGFQSYNSPIAAIHNRTTARRENRVIEIYPDYNYSRTTGKYRNQFFEEAGFPELATLAGLEKAMKEGSIRGGKWQIKKMGF